MVDSNSRCCVSALVVDRGGACRFLRPGVDLPLLRGAQPACQFRTSPLVVVGGPKDGGSLTQWEMERQCRLNAALSWPVRLLFCTYVHRFPQSNLQKTLANLKREVYSHSQIEPGSVKNFAAQLKEGAAAARQLRPQCFAPRFWPRGDLSSGPQVRIQSRVVRLEGQLLQIAVTDLDVVECRLRIVVLDKIVFDPRFA